MIVKPTPAQSIQLGHLSHHLISLVDWMWTREDDDPITTLILYRDEDFQDILTQIEPSASSNMMTPTTIGLGFDIIAQAVFSREESHAMTYDWNYRSRRQAISQTLLFRGNSDSPVGSGHLNSSQSISSPSSRDATNVDVISSNASGGGNSSNAADVRTRFSGLSMPPSRFLILLINLLQQCWHFRAQDPTRTYGEQHSLMLFRYPNEQWYLSYRHWAFEKSDGRDITWQDITFRLRRMLQLPAYLNRWETLTSEFYIGDKRIGALAFYHGADNVPVS